MFVLEFNSSTNCAWKSLANFIHFKRSAGVQELKKNNIWFYFEIYQKIFIFQMFKKGFLLIEKG